MNIRKYKATEVGRAFFRFSWRVGLVTRSAGINEENHETYPNNHPIKPFFLLVENLLIMVGAKKHVKRLFFSSFEDTGETMGGGGV